MMLAIAYEDLFALFLVLALRPIERGLRWRYERYQQATKMLIHHVHVKHAAPIALIDPACQIMLMALQLGRAHERPLQSVISQHYAIQDGLRGFGVRFSAPQRYSA